jgi:D-arabinose 1-dehydrogenase-like Zn-dependent alcohol dehydrogenase
MGGLCALDVKAGERIVIAPATGGFGGAAVEVARAMGADIVMVGRTKQALEKIRDILIKTRPGAGSIDLVQLTGQTMTDVAAIQAHGKVDKYLDFSPAAAAKSGHIATCLLSLRKGGQACFQGGIQSQVEIPYGLVMFNDLSIRGKFMYEAEDVKRLIRLVETGRLPLGDRGGLETVGTYGLMQWEAAIDAAQKETGWGKQVVLQPWKE